MFIFYNQNSDISYRCSSKEEFVLTIESLVGFRNLNSFDLSSIEIIKASLKDTVEFISYLKSLMDLNRKYPRIGASPNGIPQLDFKLPDAISPKTVQRRRRINLKNPESLNDLIEEISYLLSDSRYWTEDGFNLARERFSSQSIKIFYGNNSN